MRYRRARAMWIPALVVSLGGCGEDRAIESAARPAAEGDGGGDVAEGLPLSADEVRAGFDNLARTGGFWGTSNAEYATAESGEPDEYRMAFSQTPDGLSVTGCMWGAPTPDEPTAFWYFFHAWDPTTSSILAYQSSPSGAVAIGRESGWERGARESIQLLHIPGASDERVRHINLAVHADTLDSSSFREVPETESGWAPRRSYTWVWRASTDPVPC